MANYYTFNEKTGKCYLGKIELKRVSNNVFQWKYKDKCCDLTIEKHGTSIISAVLKTAHENKVVEQWENIDRGRAIWDKEKGGYVLQFGLPKIFYTFINDYNNEEPWTFNFHYQNHLILKDKDEQKPYYWYYYDYTPELSNFLYETLNEYISREKWVVVLPAEKGQAGVPWVMDSFLVNDWYCGEDDDYKDYDFSKETAKGWWKENGWTGLLITFLPTYFENWKLDKGKKLTGTTWFKKVWEVFGSQGVPIVLKCYRAFFFTLLYRHYRELYEKANCITELPTSIDGREVGSGNLLVYFNMQWLPKKINYKKYNNWWEAEETKNEKEIDQVKK